MEYVTNIKLYKVCRVYRIITVRSMINIYIYGSPVHIIKLVFRVKECVFKYPLNATLNWAFRSEDL